MKRNHKKKAQYDHNGFERSFVENLEVICAHAKGEAKGSIVFVHGVCHGHAQGKTDRQNNQGQKCHYCCPRNRQYPPSRTRERRTPAQWQTLWKNPFHKFNCAARHTLFMFHIIIIRRKFLISPLLRTARTGLCADLCDMHGIRRYP